MRRLIIVGTLAFLLAFTLMPIATATTDTNNPDVVIQINHSEIPIEVNCTWIEFTWISSSETFSPLPGTTWAYEVFSITVPWDIKVDIYVTDILLKGNNAEVYEIDGMTPTTANLIGITPWVPQGPTADPTATGNPDIAWNDPSYSHRMFTWYLTAGKHYFAFRGVTNPWGASTMCVKFCASNPPVGGNLLPGSSSIVSMVALVGAIGAVAIVVGSKKK